MAILADRITVNPKQCGGRPCIRGMRIRVTDVLDLLAHDLTYEQILSEHPDLESEDIRACLRFASDRLNHPVLKDEQAWTERFEATTDEQWDRLAESARKEIAAGDTDYDQLLKRL